MEENLLRKTSCGGLSRLLQRQCPHQPFKNLLNPRMKECFMSSTVIEIILMKNLFTIQICQLLVIIFHFLCFNVICLFILSSNPLRMATTSKFYIEAVKLWFPRKAVPLYYGCSVTLSGLAAARKFRKIIAI